MIETQNKTKQMVEGFCFSIEFLMVEGFCFSIEFFLVVGWGKGECGEDF